jgi:hypothetical protein
VTKAEVEAAAGFSLAAGRPITTPVGETCFYEQQSPGIATGNASVSLVSGPTAQAYYESAQKEEPGAADVPGLGDRAFVVSGEIQSNVLVMQGDVLFAVDIVHGTGTRVGEADDRQKLLTLARTALGRL